MAYTELALNLARAEQEPLHGLYTRAKDFLDDYKHPDRLFFTDSLGVASVGQEVEGSYYRLTDSYACGSFHAQVRDLIAIELVPDEATVSERQGRRLADPRVGERLWRLRPARIAYAFGGFDNVYQAAIEDLAETELETNHANRTHDHDSYSAPEYYIPNRNYRNIIEGEQLERAQHVVSLLLDKLASEPPVE
jgi:hypothetical protein